MSPLPERFWAKVDKNGPVPVARPDLGPCWVWTASKDRYGYGQFRIGGHVGSLVRAHRYAYEKLVLPAGEKLQKKIDIDHLCRVRHCCNPAHLELVTRKVNLLRGEGITARNAAATQCPQGHPYNVENTRFYKGNRLCRECGRQGNRRRNKRARESIL